MRRAPVAFTLMVVCLTLGAVLLLQRVWPKNPEPPTPTPLYLSPYAQPPDRSENHPPPQIGPPGTTVENWPPPPPPGFKNWEAAAKEGWDPLQEIYGSTPEMRAKVKARRAAAEREAVRDRAALEERTRREREEYNRRQGITPRPPAPE